MMAAKSFSLAILLALIVAAPPVYSQTKTLPEVIREAQKSVVNVQTDRLYVWKSWRTPSFLKKFFYDFFEEKHKEEQKIQLRSEGSGVVLDNQGYILTNSHVILGAERIWVVTHDKKALSAKVVGKNLKHDLALLHAEGDYSFVPIKRGDSRKAVVGETVIAIGTPHGYSQTVTKGIISGLNRTLKQGDKILLDHLIQTDAAANPGNSGGPLLSEAGEMLGIVTAREPGARGIAFAVPSEIIETVWPDLRTGEAETRKLFDFSRRFGFTPRETRDDSGEDLLEILNVGQDSRAYRGGLRPGDVIYRFGKSHPRFLEDLLEEAEKMRPSQRVYVKIKRNQRFFFTYLEAQ